jgi:hypothetical protein
MKDENFPDPVTVDLSDLQIPALKAEDLPTLVNGSMFSTMSGVFGLDINTLKVVTGSGGSSGSGSNAGSGYTYTNPQGSWSSTNAVYTSSWGSNDVKIQGNLKIDENNDILIGNVSLSDRLSKIESILGIMRPNPELEQQFDELKELGQRYKELEQELNDRLRTFNILRDQTP